jgi:serine/threonine protein kinase
MPKRQNDRAEKPRAITHRMLNVWAFIFWQNEREEINENDTTAACMGPYHCRPTYITQQSPPNLDRYYQVGLVVRDGIMCLSKPLEYCQNAEFSYLSMCSHPYINSLVDVIHEDAFYYSLILEYHPHGNLQDYLRLQEKSRFKIHGTIMLAWVKQLLEAIAHMHKLDVVHSDIKTTNIFVVEPSRLCIGDLGLAQSADTNGVGRWRCGTKRWKAPEQVDYGFPSKKSEMWNLGCVVYAAMTFKFICDLDETYVDLVNRNQHVHDLHELGSPTLNLPQIYSYALLDVVYRCLLHDPKLRPSAQELLATFGRT